jgi:hypothetical protein
VKTVSNKQIVEEGIDLKNYDQLAKHVIVNGERSVVYLGDGQWLDCWTLGCLKLVAVRDVFNRDYPFRSYIEDVVTVYRV